MTLRRRLYMLAVVDFLAAVVLMQQAILARTTIEKHRPAIVTQGAYAVTYSWKGNDDVDAYVRDPDGAICFFRATSVGLMNLEHDDRGRSASEMFGGVSAAGEEHERVVVRGAVPGEYVANAHMYSKNQAGPTRVTVELWSLAGVDRMLRRRAVMLRQVGDEETAFRFTLGPGGRFESTSLLPYRLATQDLVQGGPTP